METECFCRFGTAVTICFVALVLVAGFCIGFVEAAPFPSDWVDVGETYINIDFTGDAPYVVYHNGYIVDAVDDSFVGFHDLGADTVHQIAVHVGAPATVYEGDIRTLPSLDYFSLGLLFILFSFFLYLCRFSWVPLAPAAWLSISLIHYIRCESFMWYFEVLAAFCFVAVVVLAVNMFIRTKK